MSFKKRFSPMLGKKTVKKLLLIKSYSFMDKTRSSKVYDSSEVKFSKDADLNEIRSMIFEKNKRKAKRKKMKKSGGEEKSSLTDLDDYVDASSDPVCRIRSTPVGRCEKLKSKTSNVIFTKNDSFFRQSFRTIRRSFSLKNSKSSRKNSTSTKHEKYSKVKLNAETFKDSSFMRKIFTERKVGTAGNCKRSVNSVSGDKVITMNSQTPPPLQTNLEAQNANAGKRSISKGYKNNPKKNQDQKQNGISKIVENSKSPQIASEASAITTDKSQGQSNGFNRHNTTNQRVITNEEGIGKDSNRKKVSSSREKKFHRHFQQLPKDESLINYFSCALVSDILLQGHLYITDYHFAFYSNVFGYVTKLIIPTSTVIRISKEKTAKIIPNAVGVATIDERHVFSSFIRRESAYRLMLSLCQPPTKTIPVLAKFTNENVEDDSSGGGSVSGQESAPIMFDSIETEDSMQCNLEINDKTTKDQMREESEIISTPIIEAKSQGGKSLKSFSNNLKLPVEQYIIYLGAFLIIFLAIFSGILFYRIQQIEAKAGNFVNNFNWDSGNDDEILIKALRWQKELYEKSVEEAQQVVKMNLQQITKIRRSLEVLSSLVNNRTPAQSNLNFSNDDDNCECDKNSLL